MYVHPSQEYSTLPHIIMSIYNEYEMEGYYKENAINEINIAETYFYYSLVREIPQHLDYHAFVYMYTLETCIYIILPKRCLDATDNKSM